MAGSIKQTFVVDASFFLAHLLPDETSSYADQMLLRHKKNDIILVSTFIFPFEVLNGIRMSYLRKRIASSVARRLSEDFLNVSMPLEYINLRFCYLLAFKRKLTIYDASYVQLSLEKQISLLSLDKKLIKLASRSAKKPN